jgi:hypothetical protein
MYCTLGDAEGIDTSRKQVLLLPNKGELLAKYGWTVCSNQLPAWPNLWCQPAPCRRDPPGGPQSPGRGEGAAPPFLPHATQA